jgi:hypothetical protein
MVATSNRTIPHILRMSESCHVAEARFDLPIGVVWRTQD